jgi:hypothetical protein
MASRNEGPPIPGLEHQKMDLGIQRMALIGCIIDAVAVPSAGQQPHFDEFSYVLTHGADSKTSLPVNCAQVQLAGLDAEQDPEDFRAHPRADQLSQQVHMYAFTIHSCGIAIQNRACRRRTCLPHGLLHEAFKSASTGHSHTDLNLPGLTRPWATQTRRRTSCAKRPEESRRPFSASPALPCRLHGRPCARTLGRMPPLQTRQVSVDPQNLGCGSARLPQMRRPVTDHQLHRRHCDHRKDLAPPQALESPGKAPPPRACTTLETDADFLAREAAGWLFDGID